MEKIKKLFREKPAASSFAMSILAIFGPIPILVVLVPLVVLISFIGSILKIIPSIEYAFVFGALLIYPVMLLQILFAVIAIVLGVKVLKNMKVSSRKDIIYSLLGIIISILFILCYVKYVIGIAG